MLAMSKYPQEYLDTARRQIDARNPPALDGARGRTARHAHAIHVQHEPVVRGHADRQRREQYHLGRRLRRPRLHPS